MATRLIEQQEVQLNETRRQGLAMVTGSAAALAIFGGLGVQPFDLPVIVVMIGVVCLIGAMVCVVLLHRPRNNRPGKSVWVSGFDVEDYLQQRHPPTMTADEFKTRAAKWVSNRASTVNAATLKSLRRLLFLTMTLAFASVVFVIAAVMWSILVGSEMAADNAA